MDGSAWFGNPVLSDSEMRGFVSLFSYRFLSFQCFLYRFHHNAPEMIHEIHQAFLCLGGLTVLSAIVFRELKADDGDNVSQHNGTHHQG